MGVFTNYPQYADESVYEVETPPFLFQVTGQEASDFVNSVANDGLVAFLSTAMAELAGRGL